MPQYFLKITIFSCIVIVAEFDLISDTINFYPKVKHTFSAAIWHTANFAVQIPPHSRLVLKGISTHFQTVVGSDAVIWICF